MTAMMKPRTLSSKMLVLSLNRPPISAADDGADDTEHERGEDAQPLPAGLDEPGERADDEADHDEAEDLETRVLLRSSGVAPVPALAGCTRRCTIGGRTPRDRR